MLLSCHVELQDYLPPTAGANGRVLTGMRKCGSAAALGTMTSDVPIVAAKWGGSVDCAAEDTSILILFVNRDQFVGDIAPGALRMARNLDTQVKMGQTSRCRAEAFYDDVLGGSTAGVGAGRTELR